MLSPRACPVLAQGLGENTGPREVQPGAGSASHPLGTLRGLVGASAGTEHPCSSTPLPCLVPFQCPCQRGLGLLPLGLGLPAHACGGTASLRLYVNVRMAAHVPSAAVHCPA